ncbi:MAG: SUMF1/EgtB/PvdO family nonheme iron enzyme, partial [Polyangiaceae bacterium]|nr:SUMF1/EgtB/PvdO family nonheme iron enzyme [Polyangiaceae bacterium]
PGNNGADGLACWDLNSNGVCDLATEDTDDSGACDAADCRGPAGADGANGAPGTDGADGLACWDLNGNGVCDLASEDADSSGACEAADCQGAVGADGLNSVLSVSHEAPGTNCTYGGQRIETGLDADGDSVLDPGEVNDASTSYLCQGPPPPEVVEGASCATGLVCNSESCCRNIVVPAGTFLMGRCGDAGAGCLDESDGSSSELPEHPATVSSFHLDKYEVTVGRFRAFMNAYDAGWRPMVGQGANRVVESSLGLASGETGWQSAWDSQLASVAYQVTPGDWSLEDRITCNADSETWRHEIGTEEQEDYPINCVNWYEAFAFCVWDGGRLPTEAEWERAAAGGTDNRLYPWGWDVPTASHANSAEGANSPHVAVGSTPLGNGRWGHSDLAGSMFEWTLDWYSDTYYLTTEAGCSDCANLTAATYRAVRGNSWLAAGWQLRAAGRGGPGLSPGMNAAGVGVRCVRGL